MKACFQGTLAANRLIQLEYVCDSVWLLGPVETYDPSTGKGCPFLLST